VSRLRIQPAAHVVVPGSDDASLTKVVVWFGGVRMFDAYLYADGVWWCTAGKSCVFPRVGGGLTWNANTHDLRAFALAHAVRLGLRRRAA
jgi:hypothetical protein